jgi:hypothetical protein
MFTVSIGRLFRIIEAQAKAMIEQYTEPLLYFEDADGLHLYKPSQYVVYHSLFKQSDLFIDQLGSSVDYSSFKLLYLKEAIELLEKPKGNEITITINDETHPRQNRTQVTPDTSEASEIPY